MMRATLAFAVLAAVLLAIWAMRPSIPATGPAASAVTLQSTPIIAVPTVFPTGAQSSGLRHEEPPDPEVLRNAPRRQAIFDAEAKPGEFVTPPIVSVEH